MAAEDAGTISAQIRLELTQMEKDGLQAQKMMDNYALKFKEQGEKGGKMYVQGFGHAQLQLNTKLNNMVSSLQGVSPKLGAMGDKMASVFSKPIFSMVPAVSAAFQAMLPVIGTILAAIAVLVKGISSAAKAQKEFNDNIKLAKQAHDALNGTMKQTEEADRAHKERQDKNAVAMAKLRLAFEMTIDPIKKFGGAIRDIADKVFGSFADMIADIVDGVGAFLGVVALLVPAVAPAAAAVLVFAHNLRKVSDEEAAAAVAAQKLKEVNQGLIGTVEEYEKELAKIQEAETRGVKTKEDSAKAVLSAMDSQLDKLVELRMAALELARVEGDPGVKNAILAEAEAVKTKIEALVEERNVQAERVKAMEAVAKAEKTDQEKIDEARKSAIEKYEQAVRKANDAKRAGLIDEEEHHRQIEAALAQEYADMEAIVAQYKLNTGETVRMRDELAKQVKSSQDIVKAKENQKQIDGILLQQEDALAQQEIERVKAAAAIADSEEEQDKLLDEAIRLENELIDRQRQRAREALEQSESFIAASDDERKKILTNFDAITAGMKKTREQVKNEGGGNWLANILGMTDGQFGDMMRIGEAAVGAFDSISNALLNVSRKHAEDQIAIVEAALQSTLAQIEAARQAELEASGFSQATTEESIQAQIDRAKEAGDAVLQYQLERRKQEMEINKKYDEQAKAAEKRAAREKADIEYKLAKEEYAQQILQAANQAVMAVMQALSSAPPPFNFALAGLSGAAAAVQIGLLAANPPKPPAFASGGIVPGRKADGDAQHIIATAGELILNESQQESVAEKLGSNGTVQLTVIMMMDSVEIARSSADVYGSGQVLIPVRGIAG